MTRRVGLLRGPDGIVGAVNVPSFATPATLAKLVAVAEAEGLEVEFLPLPDIHDYLADAAERREQEGGAV